MYKLYSIFSLFLALFIISPSFAQLKPYHLKHEASANYLEKVISGNRSFISTPAPTNTPIRMIAEFEPMNGAMVVFDSQYNDFGIPLSGLKAISEKDTLYVLCSSASTSSCNTKLTAAGVYMDKVKIVIAETDSWWTRDYGPWFIVNDSNKFGVCDFPYNRPRPNDNLIPTLTATNLNIDRYGMNLTQCGGNWMSDGIGIAISTELVWEENSTLSHNDIDDLVEDYLGITTYHVVADPLGDYIKHVDCWGKLLDIDKILIGQVASSDSRYQDYEDMATYFSNSISSWGTPFQVFRVFSPGGSYVTPYTNSLILNKRVFVPISGCQYDADAIEVYKEAMPGYEIIGVQSTGWYNTDALHCRTRGIANNQAVNIMHTPITQASYLDSDIDFNAEIRAYSGQALYQDSVVLYYKKSYENTYYSSNLIVGQNFNYSTTLSNFTIGDTIDYYIYAVDMAGNNRYHPNSAAAEPHSFIITSGPSNIDDNINTKNNFSCYPNPCNGNLNIKSSQNGEYSLYNISGSLLYKGEINNGVNKLDFNGISSGVYIISIKTNEDSYTEKVIINNF